MAESQTTNPAQKLIKDLESLPPEQRVGISDASLDLTGVLEPGKAVVFSWADHSRPTTVEDAKQVYRQLWDMVSEARQQALAEGRKLVIVGGESHSNRSSLAVGAMLIDITRRQGIHNVGVEISEGPFRMPSGRQMPGLAAEKETIAQAAAAQPDAPYSALAEQDPLSYIGGPRMNRQFQTERVLSQNGSVFAADPGHQGWTTREIASTTIWREDPMVETLATQARKGNALAFFGGFHLPGIQRRMESVPEVHPLYINFMQESYLFNPATGDSKEALFQQGSAKRTIFLAQGDEHGQNRPPVVILPGAGVKTAEEALALAKAADNALGQELQKKEGVVTLSSADTGEIGKLAQGLVAPRTPTLADISATMARTEKNGLVCTSPTAADNFSLPNRSVALPGRE